MLDSREFLVFFKNYLFNNAVVLETDLEFFRLNYISKSNLVQVLLRKKLLIF